MIIINEKNVDAYMPHQQESNGNIGNKKGIVEKSLSSNITKNTEIKKVINSSSSSTSNKTSIDNDDDDDDEDELVRTHTDLCSQILHEEEMLLEAHRDQIDYTMKIVKKEMMLLKRFDSEYDVDLYVNDLDDVLAEKMQLIVDLRSKLSVFKNTLEQEELQSNTLKKNKKLK